MRGADCADNSFTDARDDCFFRRAADESIEMRTHGYSCFDFDADAVLRDAVDGGAAHRGIRRINDFWIDARPHRFQHGFAGAFRSQVDGASPIEIERDTRLISSD